MCCIPLVGAMHNVVPSREAQDDHYGFPEFHFPLGLSMPSVKCQHTSAEGTESLHGSPPVRISMRDPRAAETASGNSG